MKISTSSKLIASGAICILLAALLSIYNMKDEIKASESSDEALAYLQNKIPNLSELENIKANYTIYDDKDMPYIKFEGLEYIGILDIPSISISLPVQNNWEYSLLKKSPCRYMGNIYDDSMIVMAHNYKRHFGNIKNLNIDDSIIFTDVKGKQYKYKVSKIEKINGNNVEEMIENDWDFTIFTCDYGGKNRVTIRCIKQ